MQHLESPWRAIVSAGYFFYPTERYNCLSNKNLCIIISHRGRVPYICVNKLDLSLVLMEACRLFGTKLLDEQI